MTAITNHDIASSYAAWVEYFDVDGNMTRDEFDGLTIEQRIELLEQAFGSDA